jgi:hypothetical protein
MDAEIFRMKEPMRSGWVQERIMTRQSYADGFARIAREQSEYAGLPVPIMGEKLIIEKSYWGADKQDELNRIMNMEDTLPPSAPEKRTIRIHNAFWSSRLRKTIIIYHDNTTGKFHYVAESPKRRTELDLRTLGCADAWSLETEERALECLRKLVTHQKFRQYLLTGAFPDGSSRSGICYIFRRLRPTLAISRSNELTVIAALCLHPIAYYNDSWAGAMTPTDDVISHLMLMRGDEKMFWRRANQHAPDRPEAGL